MQIRFQQVKKSSINRSKVDKNSIKQRMKRINEKVVNLCDHFWATVCKTVRPMLSDRRLSYPVLSVLSVMLVNCGQRVE